MGIDAELLAVLACPSPDHAPLLLETVDGRDELVCTSCLSRFSISNGIPVLLPDEARPGPRGLGVATGETAVDDSAVDDSAVDDSAVDDSAVEPRADESARDGSP